MPGQKYMVGGRQGEIEGERRIGFQGLRLLEALALAAAEDIHRNGQLLAAQFALHRVFVRVDIDQLDHEIPIAARC